MEGRVLRAGSAELYLCVADQALLVRVGLSLSEVGRDKLQAVGRFDFLCEQWFNRHNGPTDLALVHQKWATAAPCFWFWHSHGG